ncbi:proline-rich protein HaeIII subfamily 1-like isoform X3 [Canis lupus familiaris]|uniref:proline-rich protein HaeIII subfamily 1-like isoform X3 n=1 Tax=Canis lupus familiaris TaxID=9615 RepID=UPI0018F57F7F|nr:proline-rich protein HaeIII subfamily 1-like isoform X3 [Canis lupus familiaris]
MRCGSGKGNPWPSPAPPEWSRGPSTHTHSPLVGPGAAGGSWALGAAGARAGLAKLNSHRPVLGGEELGKVSPTKLQGPVRRDQVRDDEFPFPQEAGTPNAPSGPPPSPRSSASPPALRRAEVGGAPGSPPSPGPPSPPPRRSMLGPGRPQRSTGAPPGSGPRAATRRRPARPGPAPPPRRPRPDRPPSGPSGRRSAGEGSEGRPRPGADTRSTPRHAGPRRGPRDPPRPVGSGTRRRRRVTLHPYPGPGASGSWSLFQHKGPGATAAALPPPLLRSKPPPQDTLRLRSPERGAEGRPPHPPRPPGPCSPGPGRGPGLGPCLPHPQRWREADSDLRRRRHQAARSQDTPPPQQLWGPLPDCPAL